VKPADLDESTHAMAARKSPKQQRKQRGKQAPVVDQRLALVDAGWLKEPSGDPLALRIMLPVLAAVFAFAAFWPALDAGFVNWDDDKTIVHNENIRGFNVDWAFDKSKMGHYHPLTWLSYSLDHAIGKARYDDLDEAAQSRYEAGLDPYIFHLNNLLLHAGVAVAFFFLARLLLRVHFPRPPDTREPYVIWAAFLATLLFACHPLRVENAVWVTERRDVLSVLFLLPCLHCYLRYALTDKNGGARIAWYVGSFALLWLSLLSKAWGITLPAVMLLLDYHPLRRFGREAGWKSRRAVTAYLDKVPFIGLAVYFAIRAKQAQAAQLSTMKTLADWGVLDRVMQFFYGLFFYSWKTLIPTGLTPLVPLTPIRITDVNGATSETVRGIVYGQLTRSVVAIVIVVAIVVLLFRLRKRWTAGIIAAICYVGTLSPILGIAQSGPQLVADKYAYVGCIIWPLLAGAGLIWLWRNRKPIALPVSVVTGLICITFAVLAFQQSKIWHDSYTLWTHAVKVNPNCVLARSNLGMLERQKDNVPTAIEHYQAAIAVDPTDFILLNNYANAVRQDPTRLGEAIEIMHRAIKLQPKMPDLRYTIADMLRESGDLDGAIAQLKHGIKLNGSRVRPKYHRRLGEIYAQMQRFDAAEDQYQIALKAEMRINPKGVGVLDAHRRLGWVKLKQRDYPAAIDHFEKALSLDENDRSARQGLLRARKLAG
jgi:tetratricopeptide (TPR) repeat protein